MCIIDDEIFLLTVTLHVHIYAVLADVLMLALLLYMCD